MNAIINGRIVLEDRVLSDHAIVYDRVIREIVPEEKTRTMSFGETLDAQGAFVSAGFINQHIHGCSGFDVMDDREGNIGAIRRALPQTGVTSFLPTTMTYDFARIHRALKKLRQEMRTDGGARVLGANVEGPFISKPYKGAHDEQYISPPAFHLIEEFVDVIKVMTVAPETIEEEGFIQKCLENGIRLSLGHSAATYEEAIAAIESGYSLITHMFNAMPPFNHRKPGVIGAALDSDAVCELITDNIHVHPAAQRILLKGKGLDQIVLVTDSMCACMLEDGEYELGGQPVVVKDQTAKLKNGVIAGSVLTMNRGVKHFMENTRLPLPEALRAVTVNPAKTLGVFDRMGSVQAGKYADFTLFNDQINIMATVVNGEVAYRRK